MANIEKTQPKQKRKRTCLSIEQKIEIIKRLDTGEKQCSVAAAYGIARQTVTNLHQPSVRQKILQQAETLTAEQGSVKKKKYTGIEASSMEKIVFSWFLERRGIGSPISGSDIQEVALAVNEKLGGPSEFKASSGWLHRFKSRHGIIQSNMQGEQPPANASGSEGFYHSIFQFITEERYTADHIYNADETELMWKGLPNKTLASLDEEAPERKIATERITVMVCANAAGNHKIPLYAIGKEKHSRCFNNINILPVMYASQKNAWMDKNLFMQWFKEVFIPAVLTKKEKESDKFLLILDNATAHPSEEVLNAVDPCIRVKYLPCNMTSLMQPMNQGVIAALKRLYRKSMLCQFLLYDVENQNKNNEKIAGFLKSWTLAKCFEKLAIAWDNVPENTLINSWNNNLKNRVIVHCDNDIDLIIYRLAEQAFKSITSEEITEWLNSDSTNCGWRQRTLEEIIENTLYPDQDVKCEEEEDDEIDEKEEQLDRRSSCSDMMIPSNSIALHCIDQLYNWYSAQWDAEVPTLLTLGHLRERLEVENITDRC